MQPFLITGMGRSGTQFIANTLSKSKMYTVTHEHPNDHVYLYPNAGDTPIKRFVENYGEVNSQLRYVAPELAKYGVKTVLLLRDPRYILRSVMQGRGMGVDDFAAGVYLIKRGIEHVVRLKNCGNIRFQFSYERLLVHKHPLVWGSLFDVIGIKDLDYYAIDFSNKIGSNGDIFTIPEPDQWSEEDKSIYREELGYFTEKLGYNGWCDIY